MLLLLEIKGIFMARVEIFTTPFCGFCAAAKALLSKKNAAFEETDVTDPALRAQVMERANGARTVPQIFIDDVHVGGFDDLVELDQEGKLDGMLKGAG